MTQAQRDYRDKLERIASAMLQGFAASGRIAADMEKAEFDEPEDTKPAAVFGVQCAWAQKAVDLAKALITELDEEGKRLQRLAFESGEVWP